MGSQPLPTPSHLSPPTPSISLASLAQPSIGGQPLSEQADLLRTCNEDIKALDTANGLQDVIFQVESGKVKKICDLYGPGSSSSSSTTTATTPTTVKWKNIKGTITKRECLYDQLITHFGGDKDKFFDFFTIQETSRKRKHKDGDEELQAMQKVVEAIPHCKADIKSEREKSIYLDSSGQFSDELWAQRWGKKNDWEVWHELGKEQY